MERLLIHPHKGFLNTHFKIEVANCSGKRIKLQPIEPYGSYVDKEKNVIFYDIDGDNYLNEIVISIPGKYIVGIDDTNLTEELIVEDAIKFGGSVYKKGYVFEDTPWCFVVMKDRTYFYNRNTKEQYVELISPDNIICVNKNIVVFSNDANSERTLYSLSQQKPILHYTEEIYLSSDTLVSKVTIDEQNFEIVVYKFDEKIITSKSFICENYSISNKTGKVYLLQNGLIRVVSLENFSVKESTMPNDFGRFIGFLRDSIAIFLLSQEYYKDIVVFYDLERLEVIFKCDAFFPIAKVGRNIVVKEDLIQKKFSEFTQVASQLDFRLGLILEYGILCIEDVYIVGDSVYYIENKQLYKYSYGKVKNIVERTLRLYNSDFAYSLGLYDHVYQYKDEVHISSSDNSYAVITDGKVIYKDKNVLVHRHGNVILFSYCNLDQTEQVFRYDRRGILDKLVVGKINWNWLNTLDVVYCWDKRQIYIFHNDEVFYVKSSCIIGYMPGKNFLRMGDKLVSEKDITLPEHVQALSESQNYALLMDGCDVYLGYLHNGEYQIEKILEGCFDRTTYRNVVFSDDASNIVFMRGKDMILKNLDSDVEYVFENRSYIEHKNGYRTTLYVDAYRRPRFLDSVNRQFIDENYASQYLFASPDGRLFADTELGKYEKIRNKINHAFVSQTEFDSFVNEYDILWDDSELIIERKKEKRRLYINQNKSFFQNAKQKIDESRIISDRCFSERIYEKLGFAIVRDIATDKIVEEIELGPVLWFLNYIAFSADSNYVAIAGRYPNGSSLGGLYLIYDLKQHRTVIKKTDVYAIWNVAFSIGGKCCGYSSVPNTYIGDYHNGDIETIEQRSFLTFSPNGKFIALSEQGYIPYKGGMNSNWGHQPSTNVYIYETKTLKQVGNVISDLADGGLEGQKCSKTVVSCSFSSDNSKLMMVGSDGTIVVRNIYLNDYAEE